jgi:hypothetical protein
VEGILDMFESSLGGELYAARFTSETWESTDVWSDLSSISV